MKNPAGFAPTLEIAPRLPHCHPPTTARLVQYKIKKVAFLSHTLRLPSGSFFNWKRLQGSRKLSESLGGYVLEFARGIAADVLGLRVKEGIVRLQAEADNIRSSLEWCLVNNPQGKRILICEELK